MLSCSQTPSIINCPVYTLLLSCSELSHILTHLHYVTSGKGVRNRACNEQKGHRGHHRARGLPNVPRAAAGFLWNSHKSCSYKSHRIPTAPWQVWTSLLPPPAMMHRQLLHVLGLTTALLFVSKKQALLSVSIDATHVLKRVSSLKCIEWQWS